DVVRALARRDFLTTRSYRLTFVLDVFYGVVELAVYFFISHALGDVGPESLHGAPSYFAFAAVGVIMAALLAAGTASIAANLRQEQLAGTMEVLAAQPMTAPELCVGMVSFPFAYASVRAVLYL